ncbi:MAG: hypothetical protein JSS95_09400 [Acidobacteria bacterium]|nr:hypothetical protein [Acidobacteriota bacterium]
MPYLSPTEYVQYGLSAETADSWIAAASALIDAHCRRTSLAVTQYVENVRLTAGSQSIRLSNRPLAAAAGSDSPLVQVRVRYGRPRRGELNDPFFAHVAWAFSLPGSWSILDITAVDVNLSAGEITLPVNIFGMCANEVEIIYTAGCTEIPAAIKIACAQIVKNAQATPALNVKSNRVDTLQVDYFAGVLVDAEVQTLLRPYVSERLG